jgi:hypothetical protein
MASSKKVSTFWCGKVMIGGADGIRTHYLLNAIEALSRLSYSPIPDQSTIPVEKIQSRRRLLAQSEPR